MSAIASHETTLRIARRATRDAERAFASGRVDVARALNGQLETILTRLIDEATKETRAEAS